MATEQEDALRGVLEQANLSQFLPGLLAQGIVSVQALSAADLTSMEFDVGGQRSSMKKLEERRVQRVIAELASGSSTADDAAVEKSKAMMEKQ